MTLGYYAAVGRLAGVQFDAGGEARRVGRARAHAAVAFRVAITLRSRFLPLGGRGASKLGRVGQTCQTTLVRRSISRRFIAVLNSRTLEARSPRNGLHLCGTNSSRRYNQGARSIRVGVNSPTRISRARLVASRRFVFTRSPDLRGISQ